MNFGMTYTLIHSPVFEEYQRVEKKWYRNMAHQLRVLTAQFDSQHLQGSSQPYVTPKGPAPSSAHLGHYTHMVYTYTYMQTKTLIHIKDKK